MRAPQARQKRAISGLAVRQASQIMSRPRSAGATVLCHEGMSRKRDVNGAGNQRNDY